MSLRSLARDVDDVLHPIGQRDALLLYAVVAEAARGYLGDRELATKIHLPNGPSLIKRGSDLPPLTAERLIDAVDEAFLRARNEHASLDDARAQLSDQQILVWQYVLPRKLGEFHYATNHEGEGAPIDRVVFDIDRGEGVSLDDALAVTRRFVAFLEDDPVASDIAERLLISHTGYSFHVELLLGDRRPPSFYRETLFTTEREDVDTVTDRAVTAVKDDVDVPVRGGHEKQAGAVTIDPSQTPSGKLNRVPLGSLHVADPETIDGISVPVTADELFAEDVADRLASYTPQRVIDRLDELAARLPQANMK